MAYSKIVLKSGKDDSIRRQHPWIFSGAIKKTYGNLKEGDIVEVYSNKDELLGSGHYQDGSITVRILVFGDTPFTDDIWEEKIRAAYDYRLNTGLINNTETDTFRLIFAEGDGLPGLIIDYYAGNAVIQTHSIGMYKSLQKISESLQKVFGDTLKSVYNKSSETLPKHIESENEYLFGEANEQCIVKENSHLFEIDWVHGQKTGFFIDQRENRQILGSYSKGKKVLNTFCYSGSFSVYAAKAGAEMVHSVDSSAKAIDLTNKNMKINDLDIDKHPAFVSDTMSYLQDMEEEYDIIILDPPAFAKHKNVRHNAVIGYKRLNAMAMKKIKKGGILFTFSCSQVVNRKLFESTVIAAAIQSGRKARIMHHLSQPTDHPVSAFHPEGEYLKGLVLYIE